jgi:hypothetical protein
MSTVSILGILVVALAVLALVPALTTWPLLAVGLLLAGVALILLGGR